MRQSGRTTRMLKDAERLALEGRAVYVLAANELQRCLLRDKCGEKAYRLGIKFESPGSLGSSLDWFGMRILGSHPNCVLLADHFAIESALRRAIEMMHRYDLKQEDRA